jgi:hypothetical protein
MKKLFKALRFIVTRRVNGTNARTTAGLRYRIWFAWTCRHGFIK